MGIQTQQRIGQALEDVEVLMTIVRSLTHGLSEAEQRIKDLEQRLGALETTKRNKSWPSTSKSS
jgi:septal ring factor EnvC (AmiA/AmiB activator)